MQPAPKKKAAPSLFPIFIKLAGCPCLVVGAGPVAEGKIVGLLDAAAKIRVVAPEATGQICFWAATGQIERLARPFEPTDLDGMFLVVAATNSHELHENILAEARSRGVLCNIVDVPELCDFYYPAVVQRGALQIAVSTSGQSPALAQRLRKELEEQFGPEYEAWLLQLGEERQKLFAANMDPDERKRLLHDLASADSFKSFLRKRKRSKNKINLSRT